MTTIAHQPANIFVRAAQYAEAGDAFGDDNQELLETYLKLRTLDARGHDSDKALTACSDHPGYLTREVGSARIYVPFNLAETIPDEAALQTALDIGEAIRVGREGALCLSGSGAFLGELGLVADLDFSEYYVGAAEALRADVLGKLDCTDPVLVWVKAGGATHAQPWPVIDKDLPTAPNRVKLDFVSNTSLGILPTTSVVLVTSSGEDQAASQSFAFQEVVVQGPTPLRVLVRPDRLGDYISWLRKEVARLLQREDAHASAGTPIKALKRCLSLFVMLARPEEIDAIVEQLRSDVLTELVVESRLMELEQMAHAIQPVPRWLSDEIQTLKVRTVFPAEAREQVLTETTALATHLYEIIGTMFAEAA